MLYRIHLGKKMLTEDQWKKLEPYRNRRDLQKFLEIHTRLYKSHSWTNLWLFLIFLYFLVGGKG